MFQLESPASRNAYAVASKDQIENMTDEHGNVIYEQWPVEPTKPRPLRKFAGVPQVVSQDTPT